MNGIWQGGKFVLQSTIEERLARVTTERDRLREALELADQYITNGIELGYIHLPDAPDPALETPIKIRTALQEAGDDNQSGFEY